MAILSSRLFWIGLAAVAWSSWCVSYGYEWRDAKARRELAAKNAEIAVVNSEIAIVMAANDLARQAAVDAALAALPKPTGKADDLPDGLLKSLNRIK